MAYKFLIWYIFVFMMNGKKIIVETGRYIHFKSFGVLVVSKNCNSFPIHAKRMTYPTHREKKNQTEKYSSRHTNRPFLRCDYRRKNTIKFAQNFSFFFFFYLNFSNFNSDSLSENPPFLLARSLNHWNCIHFLCFSFFVVLLRVCRFFQFLIFFTKNWKKNLLACRRFSHTLSLFLTWRLFSIRSQFSLLFCVCAFFFRGCGELIFSLC